VGPRTIQSMKTVRATVLAFDSSSTLLIRREEVLAEAEKLGIAMVAL